MSTQIPPVNPPALVLLTGINGHLASAIALRLLEKGYKVRGTVRKLRSASYIQKEFERFGDLLEIVETGNDIVAPGVFDNALQGVDAVVHAASPVTMDAKTKEEQYVPAVDGTLNILRSAQKVPSVKRFLYLGSLGSVVMADKDYKKEKATRDDWNVVTEKMLEQVDNTSPAFGFLVYIGSKLVAEKAAWEFVKQEKPQFGFTAIDSAITLGPIHKELTGPPRQDQSLGMLYDTLAKPPRVKGVSPVRDIGTVHVYDLADLFVASLTSEKTPGKRLLAVSAKTSWYDVTELVKSKWPGRTDYPVKDDTAPHQDYPGALDIVFDTDLEKELLGGGWRSLEDSVLSAAKDLIAKEEKGWDKL
ncbi:NAD(P)-binding protein [Panus rudis PR-1116 ss-1]|nr:NAD(P)-binding protein [Panus rudis PR-1116 ss-1]WJQ78189.1 ketoreductase [Panus rudis]